MSGCSDKWWRTTKERRVRGEGWGRRGGAGAGRAYGGGGGVAYSTQQTSVFEGSLSLSTMERSTMEEIKPVSHWNRQRTTSHTKSRRHFLSLITITMILSNGLSSWLFCLVSPPPPPLSVYACTFIIHTHTHARTHTHTHTHARTHTHSYHSFCLSIYAHDTVICWETHHSSSKHVRWRDWYDFQI